MALEDDKAYCYGENGAWHWIKWLHIEQWTPFNSKRVGKSEVKILVKNGVQLILNSVQMQPSA